VEENSLRFGRDNEHRDVGHLRRLRLADLLDARADGRLDCTEHTQTPPLAFGKFLAFDERLDIVVAMMHSPRSPPPSPSCTRVANAAERARGVRRPGDRWRARKAFATDAAQTAHAWLARAHFRFDGLSVATWSGGSISAPSCAWTTAF